MSEATEDTEFDTQTDSDPSAEAAGVTDESSDAASAQGETEELDPIQKLEAEVAQWKDRALRSQAEMENFRKRSAREKADAIRYANSNLLGELMPILDNFDMGLQAARQESADSVITQGMGMVHKQLHDFLDSQGVKRIEAEGATFDPNLHEAVSQDFSDDIPEGDIITVLRQGYRLADRLLRAATVVVSKGPAPEASSERADNPNG